jgi:hypothetical protein
MTDSGPILALSIRQPWCAAIMYLGKTVENRTWPTAFRGEFYIHAGKTVERDCGFEDELLALDPRPRIWLGGLIATARLVDCVRIENINWDYGDKRWQWAVGPWCFVIDDVKPLAKPIQYKGKLGFFSVALGDYR